MLSAQQSHPVSPCDQSVLSQQTGPSTPATAFSLWHELGFSYVFPMERGFGMNIHTTLCKTDNQQGPTVYHNTQYSVIPYMRKESEKECITVSLFCIPETNTTLYIHSTALFFCKSVNGEKYTMLTLTERKKGGGDSVE